MIAYATRTSAAVRAASCCLAAIAMLAAASGTAAAEPTVLIIDGSGSMWGKLDGSQKILIVQSALDERLPLLADDFEVGLFAFGHRRAKNCEDIEELAPVAKLDREALAVRIGALSPRGKTPLALTLERAAAALPADRTDGRIVLIADGADNCRRDACATAAEIASGTPGRRIDVIALGVDDNDMPRVSCIAKNSGGELRTAQTAAELASALDVLLVAPAGAAPKIADDQPEAKKIALVEPSSLSATVRLADGAAVLTEGVFWRVRATVGDGSELYSGDQPPDRLALPTGRYEVEALVDHVRAVQSVEVAAEGPTRLDLVLGAGILDLKAVRPGAAAGAPPTTADDVFFTVYKSASGDGGPGETVAISRAGVARFILPAGTYRVLLESGLARIERTIKLVAGGSQSEELTLDIGTLELEARPTADAPPLDRVVYSILVDDPVAPGGVREIARSSRPLARLALPAGVYRVRASAGAAEATVEVSVRSGQLVKHSIILASGRLRATARLGGREETVDDPVEFRVLRATDGTEVVRTSRSRLSAELPAGRYRVLAMLGDVNASAESEFELAAGEDKEIAVEIDAGTVSISVAAVEGKPAVGPSKWEIVAENGRLLWTTTDAAPRISLHSGNYEVVATVRGQRLRQRFTLVAGEIKSVEVRPE